MAGPSVSLGEWLNRLQRYKMHFYLITSLRFSLLTFMQLLLTMFLGHPDQLLSVLSGYLL